MALAILNQPCSSKFASFVYAAFRGHRSHDAAEACRRSFGSSPLRGQDSLTVNRAQAVEAAADNIELSKPAAYVSTSSDPWFNLSYEDWLLRNSPRNQPTLFLYRNDPCVVIGRNQNPWQEATPRLLKEWGIPLVRRRSGGGTVFHDQGNTNFSIILPRLLFTRSHGANLVAKAVRERLGVKECTVNERNDVTIRDEAKMKDFKVSGSAYKIIQHRAYHHGTMLISSDLSNLGRAIRSSSPNIQGKSVPSFRSPVTTLNTYLPSDRPDITHDSFVQAVLAEFGSVYRSSSSGATGIDALDREHPDNSACTPNIISEADSNDKIEKGINELKSWEWTYGQTPEFSNEIEGDLSFGNISVSVTARHAIITSATIHFAPPATASTSSEDKQKEHVIQREMDELALKMIGHRYEALEGLATPQGKGLEQRTSRIGEVVDWLRRNM